MYITIGRNPQSDVVISGFDTVSFDHAIIEYENGRFLFIDDSSNGSVVNGEHINHESRPVQQGDPVLLAGVCNLDWSMVLSKVRIEPVNASADVGSSRSTVLRAPQAVMQEAAYQQQQQQQQQPVYQQPVAPQQPAYQQPQNPAPRQDSISNSKKPAEVNQINQVVNVVVDEKKSNGIGTAGFVLALCALLFCWIPVVNWILWILGLIFSIIGVCRKPKGLAITGLVISFIGIIIDIILLTSLASALS